MAAAITEIWAQHLPKNIGHEAFSYSPFLRTENVLVVVTFFPRTHKRIHTHTKPKERRTEDYLTVKPTKVCPDLEHNSSRSKEMKYSANMGLKNATEIITVLVRTPRHPAQRNLGNPYFYHVVYSHCAYTSCVCVMSFFSFLICHTYVQVSLALHVLFS